MAHGLAKVRCLIDDKDCDDRKALYERIYNSLLEEKE